MITTLQASITLSDWQMATMDPQEIDDYIHEELARQLVNGILNEDLIQVSTDRDLSINTLTARTRLKIIQE